MLKRALVLLATVLVTLVAIPETTMAQSGNVRLLLHSTKPISSDSSFGWNAWVVAPNVTSVPNKWLVVAGPRLKGRKWASEFNIGAFVQNGETTPTIDVRTSWPFPVPFTLWTNIDWTDFKSLYVYGEVNYPLPGGLIAGIETENNLPKKSFGPHLVIPFGTTAVAAAYQFQNGEDQLWFRLVVNFR